MPGRKASRAFKIRLVVVGCLVCVAGAAVVTRMWLLQVRRAGWLRELARQQVLKQITIEPLRGPILDRNGTPLAVSVEARSVYAMPRQLENPRTAALQLARALELDQRQTDSLVRRLTRRKIFTWVKRRLPERLTRRVQQLGLKGVGFITESRRYYPAMRLAANLLGFCGDGKGLEGIELLFDDRLRGSAVVVQGLRDARGRLLFPQGAVHPQSGDTLVLTIDANIQEIVERELEKGLAKARARAAMAVVADPHTGEILAAAVRPTFNPNVYWRSRPEQRRNRIVTDCFEPGSTMKVFTMAAAMKRGLVEPDDKIDCEGGNLRVADHVIHDAHRGLGLITATDVLVHSSNVGIAKIGMLIGKQGLYEELSRFGFGRKTGIDLPGEVGCSMRPHRTWSDVGLATISFGQGISVSVIQLVAALNAVGNGGVWLRPLLVKRIQDASGRVEEQAEPDPHGRVIDAEDARKLVQMMTGVVRPGGTGTAAAVGGIDVAGKTGTAQKVDPFTGGYSPHLRVASFMGLVPADNPRLSIVVVMDEPQASPYGGVVAAPVFREIASATLRYVGVFPDGEAEIATAEEPSQQQADTGAAPSVETAVVPGRHEPARSAGAGTVPDLAGQGARHALVRLWRAGYRVEMEGYGVVARQQPEAGSAAPAGTRVRLWLTPGGAAAGGSGT